MRFKKDDIIIKDRPHSYNLKYRVTQQNRIGDIDLVWGLRIKYDRKINEWVSFGQERALLGKDLRLFTPDDLHYLI